MKRLSAGIFLFILTLSLTSCKVNWFDRQLDAEWWQIAIPLVIWIAILTLVCKIMFTDNIYRCTKCEKTFIPEWWKPASTVHINNDRLLKCPHCGKKSFCKYVRRKRGKDNERQE